MLSQVEKQISHKILKDFCEIIVNFETDAD